MTHKEHKTVRGFHRMMAWRSRIDHSFDNVAEPDGPITPEEKAIAYTVIIILGLVIFLGIVLGSIALVETQQAQPDVGGPFGF
jgi:hypothetical protein